MTGRQVRDPAVFCGYFFAECHLFSSEQEPFRPMLLPIEKGIGCLDLYWSATLNNADQNNNDGDDQEDVNESSQGIGRDEAQEPQNQ